MWLLSTAPEPLCSFACVIEVMSCQVDISDCAFPPSVHWQGLRDVKILVSFLFHVLTLQMNRKVNLFDCAWCHPTNHQQYFQIILCFCLGCGKRAPLLYLFTQVVKSWFYYRLCFGCCCCCCRHIFTRISQLIQSAEMTVFGEALNSLSPCPCRRSNPYLCFREA